MFLLCTVLCSAITFAQKNQKSDMPDSGLPKGAPVVLNAPGEIPLTSVTYYNQLRALNPAGSPLKVQVDPGSSDVISQQFETANSAKTTNVADDFTVPADKRWSIESVSAIGNFVGSVQPTIFNVTFYSNDSNNLPGTAVHTETIVLAAGTATPTLPLASPLMLTSGTYWVSIQAVLNLSTQGAWYWKTYNAFDTFGFPFAIKNPGNGYGIACLMNWTYYSVCTSSKFKDLQLTITGTESDVPCKTITDRLATTDLTHVGRMIRILPASVCGTPKAFPGYFATTGNFHYKTYNVTNTSAASQCITFNLSNADPAAYVHLTAYNTTFNPADLSQNYRGDIANSSGLGGVQTMSIDVPANSTVVLVASEPVANSVFTADYTIEISSSDCATILKTSDVHTKTINLYPNPTKDNLHISGMTLKTAKVTDPSGKLISVKTFGNDVNVENLVKGTYIITMEDKDGNVYNEKFIKN